ncbi:MAG: RES family NAD+ phosphorylase [Verrucomicrobia bacterium]|nr:RES family NAD+ phosphorylase [Verrucomicrobiota bacterium]
MSKRHPEISQGFEALMDFPEVGFQSLNRLESVGERLGNFMDGIAQHWRAEPVVVASQQFGEDWFRRGPTAVLAIPSAIIPEEENYVINPARNDSGDIPPQDAS